MNLQDWSAIAEMVGAAGVIVSLLFVGFELRRNTKAVTATNHESATSRLIQQSHLVAEDPEIARIWLEGLKSFGDLTKIDKVRFGSMIYATLADCGEQWSKHRRGLIDERTWEPVELNLQYLLRKQGVREWMQSTPMALPSDFAKWMGHQALGSTKASD